MLYGDSIIEDHAWKVWQALKDRIEYVEGERNRGKATSYELKELYGLQKALSIVEDLYPKILKDVYYP